VNPSQLTGQSGQRWRREDHADVNWFRRGRECLKCGHEFVTAEWNEDYVEELVELRDALSDIKRHAENYLAESDRAEGSLRKLSESLSVLRALDLYRQP
jgi:hypothetical protein